MESKLAELTWRDGDTPVSTRFDDSYFSPEDGLAETHYVFLDGNDLPDRLEHGFEVAELGFGTGLNALALAAAWEATGRAGDVRFTSFEAWPMTQKDAARALAAFPALAQGAKALMAQWGRPEIRIGRMLLRVIEGDARQTVPVWNGAADAWFLDGFAPARNPELWGPGLMQAVAAHTKPDGTAATYSAAGHVRRALEAAGFAVDRVPGFGRKRHMVRAHLP